MKKLAILGSTGSIGTSTLSICESFPERYQPIALAAGQNLETALAQCLRWRPQVISVATEELAAKLQSKLKTAGITGIEVVHGTAGTVRVATLPVGMTKGNVYLSRTATCAQLIARASIYPSLSA